MPQLNPGPSELDARLAEIDRRLREIQAGLAPELAMPAAQPPPAEELDPQLANGSAEAAAVEVGGPPDSDGRSSPSPAGTSPRSGPLATLLARTRRRRTEADVEEFARLVRMHNGLLEAVGELVRLLASQAGPASAPPPAGLVSAGPFGDTREVESFLQALTALPPVREATLVGYEGSDRALIDVQLAQPSG